jgi:hypothetical protein
MKKILVALGFVIAASSANANIVSGGLTVVGSTTAAGNTLINNSTTDGSDGLWGGDSSALNAGIYTSGNAGTLIANASGYFTATYLGQVAGFPNKINNGMVMNGVVEGTIPGTTVGQAVTAGSTIPFSFIDGGNTSVFANGQTNTAVQGMIFLDAAIWNALHPGSNYDFLIGYNDTAPVNADYDDYVVGVVNHVPVPAALPLMASALGMFGVARRKSKKAA